MPNPTVLVTGATGTIGRRVVMDLVAQDVDVRALTRRPEHADLPAGVDVRAGDLARPETLAAAFDGVDALFLFPHPGGVREVVAQARESGVGRVVTLSSGAVTAGMDAGRHLAVERAVEESGVAWTHVRPGEFATNRLEVWGPGIRAHRTIRDPSRTPGAFRCTRTTSPTWPCSR